MNMQQLMQQAQRMQRDIQNKKSEIERMTFTGKSEWIEIEFDGNKNIKKLSILKDEVIDSDDKEMLEDMLMIAIKDAFKQIDKVTEEKLGSYASMSGLI